MSSQIIVSSFFLFFSVMFFMSNSVNSKGEGRRNNKKFILMCFTYYIMSFIIRLGDTFFFFFLELARENGTISEGILRDALSATEDNFLSLVRRAFAIKPLIAAVGSCCLVGVIWKGTLHIANLGDSRAVLGSVGRSKKVVAEQLTTDHNASMEEVRRELKSLHPEDSQVVVMKDGVWRIKGIIQVFFLRLTF